MNSTMIEKIMDKLVDPKELDKKQISVFLKKDQLKSLDDAVNLLKSFSDKNISRNFLIEVAVEALLENIPTAIEQHKKKYNIKKDDDFDTVIYPCTVESDGSSQGLSIFLEQKKWYYVRINEDKIKKVKYIALYLGAPISKISYYGKVSRFESIIYNGKDRYIVYLDGDPIKLEHDISLGSTNPLATRSPKYTSLEKLKKATVFSDLN